LLLSFLVICEATFDDAHDVARQIIVLESTSRFQSLLFGERTLFLPEGFQDAVLSLFLQSSGELTVVVIRVFSNVLFSLLFLVILDGGGEQKTRLGIAAQCLCDFFVLVEHVFLEEFVIGRVTALSSFVFDLFESLLEILLLNGVRLGAAVKEVPLEDVERREEDSEHNNEGDEEGEELQVAPHAVVRQRVLMRGEDAVD
jgi:hypothetical protein